MDSKADVKAIMARFNAGGSSVDVGSGGRPKPAVHPTLSSGPPIQAKKPVLETSLSGSAATSVTTPKSPFMKSTVSSPEVREFSKPKAILSKFENAQEDSKPPLNKHLPIKPKLSDASKDSESKGPFPKTPLQKPSLSSTLSDSKAIPPKPPSVGTKPPWVKDTPKSEDNATSSTPAPPKFPCPPKPKSSLSIMRHKPPEENSAGDSAVKPPSGSNLKSSVVRNAQAVFNKEKGETQDDNRAKEGIKPPSSNDSSAPKPQTPQKPNYLKKNAGSTTQANEDPSAPKRNQLPNIFALGSPPAKPNRPPKVDLEKFKKGLESGDDGPVITKGNPSLPLASHPSNAAPALPSHPGPPNLPPSLPPRHPGPMTQSDPNENYDDVGIMNKSTPLPIGGHPSQRHEDNESDGEMYEDLEDRWLAAESKEQDKKLDKGDKKRLEQEKKDQKERERKEQEARKKFKISGPIQVIHKVKAKVDCKGGKNDLSAKQGETIEILRISDNPEGRWLGRSPDGSYGYVKTDSVQIDFEKLKNLPGQMDDLDVYDDVAPQDDFKRGPAVILPPPLEGDGDIYDDLDDPSLMISSSDSKPLSKSRGILRILKGWDDWRKSPVNEVPPPPQFTPEGNADKSAALIDEDIYDDVESQGFPPPPPLSSLPQLKTKPKAEDAKKQKKFEKEEKEFRKKFKFDGDIQVLYQATVVSTLNNKKWGPKELPLKPGENLDVISKAEPNKLICRNDEGKFGYVSVNNIQTEDGEIYDDIGDDCIYDND